MTVASTPDSSGLAPMRSPSQSKATGLGNFFPFYMTANEVRCSDDIPDQYHLFRVFNMGRKPQIYILHGSLKMLCQLEPILFRAVI